MTDKSICAKCAELVRLKVSGIKREICSEDGIEEFLQLIIGKEGIAIVQECSRFVKVPEEA